ncbi:MULTISPECIES: thioesterase family protein [Bacillota]|jgi:fluoroacetyl-CoA thioesterase|uniref:Thioesterase family protein n=2 Tax=Amedibacillus TaxID=2749846 RepID=A0A7G9GTM6_9FIRM|nr:MULTISPECIES: thioesterase family protein [Bacillota]QNM14158.1 thioesterase family protein [[Eubacterium] hominis]MCH4287402.1 thioesterase family protein [Amedibacillus hominis]RGB49002.1 dihydrolipoamide acyltransferase [Absiella sp. AM22-9]RGB54133.1 dihydrolipoamide acyltransferase [Absiella sp. AM10-20]RGB62976.1 dihydrolipoamide acyltransferase [Absiella sp. AM09-45]
MKEIKIGSVLTKEITVTDDLLACHVGSGIVNVYATPMMIALMENTACECLNPFLDEGETSVGVMMNTTHDAATPAGMKVSVTAEITAVDRKKVSFSIIAKDEKDVIGKASHDRFVVVKEKFETKAQSKLQ